MDFPKQPWLDGFAAAGLRFEDIDYVFCTHLHRSRPGGDVIHIRGHTSDFTQKVESLEVNHAPVTEVGPDDDFGLKVVEHAREHDKVYKVRS